MEFMRACVATARIRGLKAGPYYFDAKCFYAMRITFEDASTVEVNNIPFIYLSEEKAPAEKAYERIAKTFEEAGIHEGDTVALLFTEMGSVFAIGKTGSDKWVDAKDHFTLKKFSDMDYIFTSLKVY